MPVLRKLIDDVEAIIRNRAMKSFELMAEVKDNIGGDIRRMIEDHKRRGI
ncbi:MAG: hypothetical protein GX817_03230 [Elusimicrobia bacterium]|nr:hypothetical protein [Elusimicrobiota bacterium]